MKKKDLIVLGAALGLALALFALVRSGLLERTPGPQLNSQQAQGSSVTLSALSGGSERQLSLLQPGDKREEAEAYLLINVNNQRYAPLPLDEELRVTIRQPDGKENVALIARQGVHMQSATCPGQECIHQGRVTLDNRDLRALYNQIICLPNTVMLDVLDAREAALLYGETP